MMDTMNPMPGGTSLEQVEPGVIGPHHGGDLASASEAFKIPLERWIDLSTGISPWSWPVPELPEYVWRRLPPRKDGLEAAAGDFYQSEVPLLAVPGSQWAIAQLCPALLQLGEVEPGQKVAVPLRGYQEHRFAWAQAGLRWVEYRDVAHLLELVEEGAVDHAVVIAPNNPTGEVCSSASLQALASELGERRGWLVVDQAFADLDATVLCDLGSRSVILRSLGKFFGLAGLRVGFVAAPARLRGYLQAQLGPWGLAHPARFIAEQALLDRGWHQRQREAIAAQSELWSQWLRQRLGQEVMNAGLFCTIQDTARSCAQLYQTLGQRGVLVRIFEPREGRNLVRFGLPATSHKAQWASWFASI